MKVIVNSNLILMDTPSNVLGVIKKELTMDNPEYLKRVILRLPIWNIEKKLQLYEEIDSKLILPRGYCFRLGQLINELKVECTWDIQKTKFKPIKYDSVIKLRDYQNRALMSLKQFSSGVIIMPCGSGKTETGLEIIANLGQPTLWLTHTKDLLNQSKDRAISRLNLKRGQHGIIGAGSYSIGTHITFATVQSLANRDLLEIKDSFGCVVIDEAHHCFRNPNKVGQFQKVISQLSAYYRIGLTASEYRSDGLIETMFHVIGPKMYEVDQDTLKDNNTVITPTVEYIDTNYLYESFDDRFNFSKMLKDMAADEERNKLIIRTIKDKGEGNYCLVLGDSLSHLEHLSKEIGGSFICGKTPKKQREKILEDMKQGKIGCLFATYQLAKEGLDIPRLNRLFLITPKKDKVIIQQSVGRISRVFEGKTDAVVFDFFDRNVGVCVSQARKRSKEVYEKLGCTIINNPRKRKRKVS